MKRVLVTGAKGFIGKPCIEALQNRNFEVHAISSQPVPKSTAVVTWHQSDLHDYPSVKELLASVRPSHLLHLAWYVEHGSFWCSEENLSWVSSSINLVKEFINNGGRRVVCMGTCAEYDWGEETCSKSLSEKVSLIAPGTVYGASKAGLYMIINALCQLKGINLAWGRLFFPYGPHEAPERLIPNMVSSLLRRTISVCKQPDLQRDFIFVQDIAEIMAMLVDSQLVGPINVASGQAVRLGDLVGTIAKLLNAEDFVQYGSSSAKNDDPSMIVGDITRLQYELGFTETVSLESGLQKTIDWWSKEYQLVK